MSVTLIIPAARDGPGVDGKPTWLLQHPRGSLVLESVLLDLGLENVARIILSVQQRHIDAFCGGDAKAVEALVASRLKSATQYAGVFIIHVLARKTSSAPDTVVETIQCCGVSGAIFIKDCDGSFPHRVEVGSYVVGMRLHAQSDVENLPAKSFLECNGTILTNIQEKQVISDTICVGGYGFDSAQSFCETFRRVEGVQRMAALALGNPRTEKAERLTQSPVSSTDINDRNAGGSGDASVAVSPGVARIFTSHIVYHMMLEQRKVFAVALTTRLDDWKTEAAWRKFVSKHSNILIALEGVLFANRSANVLLSLVDESKALAPIQQNIEYLRHIVQRGQRSRIIVTTRRPVARREETVALLRKHEIPFDDVVFGMLGSMSCIIGAYGNDIQHPSVVSYCVPHGSAQLGSVLHLH